MPVAERAGNETSGKAVSWLVLLSTALISFDVVMPYLSKPLATTPFGDFIRSIWFTYNYSYDMSDHLYATLFMIGGAYALSRAQHVRGDIFYRKAYQGAGARGSLPLHLRVLSGHPRDGVGRRAVGRVFVVDPRASRHLRRGPSPLYPLKTVIPIAALLMAIQGVVETIRCVQALRTGVWPPRLSDCRGDRGDSRAAERGLETRDTEVGGEPARHGYHGTRDRD